MRSYYERIRYGETSIKETSNHKKTFVRTQEKKPAVSTFKFLMLKFFYISIFRSAGTWQSPHVTDKGAKLQCQKVKRAQK